MRICSCAVVPQSRATLAVVVLVMSGLIACTERAALATTGGLKMTNKSQAAADGFTGTTATASTFVKSASGVELNPAGANAPATTAFNGVAFPANTTTFTWGAASNPPVNDVPAGGSMKFKFEYTGIGGFRRADLSFRNGATNITTACAPVDESFSPFAGQAVVSLTNTEPTDTITMSNIIVRYNDPGNLSDTVNYTPGGTVALGTPTSLVLTPGQTFSFMFSGADLSQPVSISSINALSSSPSDQLDQFTAGFVPEPQSLGLIALAALTGMLRGRRYPSALH